ECVPIGHAVNPTIAMVTGFSCHADAAEAGRRGTDGFRFFQFALAYHYVFGTHTPGRTNIWNQYLAVRDQIGTEVLGAGAGCIGTPAELRESLRIFQDAGVDQTIFIQQGGKNRHDHICEGLELFAAEASRRFDGSARSRSGPETEVRVTIGRRRRSPWPLKTTFTSFAKSSPRGTPTTRKASSSGWTPRPSGNPTCSRRPSPGTRARASSSSCTSRRFPTSTSTSSRSWPPGTATSSSAGARPDRTSRPW